MIDYELVLLVSPQVADDKVTDTVEKITQSIATQGGKVTTVNPWGRRRLAYHIKDFQEATYVLVNFSADSKVATTLNNQLRINEDVIRFLMVKAQAPKPEPKEAAVAAAK